MAINSVKDKSIDNMYGFVLTDNDCIGFISDDNKYLTLLCDDGQIDTYDISSYNANTTISTIVNELYICNFEDIGKIFTDENDLDLTISY